MLEALPWASCRQQNRQKQHPVFQAEIWSVVIGENGSGILGARLGPAGELCSRRQLGWAGDRGPRARAGCAGADPVRKLEYGDTTRKRVIKLGWRYLPHPTTIWPTADRNPHQAGGPCWMGVSRVRAPGPVLHGAATGGTGGSPFALDLHCSISPSCGTAD